MLCAAEIFSLVPPFAYVGGGTNLTITGRYLSYNSDIAAATICGSSMDLLSQSSSPVVVLVPAVLSSPGNCSVTLTGSAYGEVTAPMLLPVLSGKC